MASPTITSLPSELTELILVLAAFSGDYSVISTIASVCKDLRALVYDSRDSHLWRQIFLAAFDDPRTSQRPQLLTANPIHWADEYRRRIRAQTYIARLTANRTPVTSPVTRSQVKATGNTPLTEDDQNLARALVSAVTTSTPSKPYGVHYTINNASDPDGSSPVTDKYPIFLPTLRKFAPLTPSRNITWLSDALASGYPPSFIALLEGEHWSGPADIHRALCCTGFLLPAYYDGEQDALRKRVRHNARVHVYDTQYPAPARHWGPFLRVDPAKPGLHAEEPSEGAPAHALRVDWAWLSAARVVVEANLLEASASSAPLPLAGLTQLDGVRAHTAPNAIDWAGVAGVWRRCVCWMDYRDLVLNNLYSRAQRFTDSTLLEAVRVIPMTLRVVSTGEPSARWPDRPPLHVEGDVAGAQHPRRIRGTVRMTADDNIRWSLTSTSEDGLSEWETEGVQIGCVSSAMGVLGLWTGSTHERTDPLGPYWQWKVG